MDPDQTAPYGAVWSGSQLLAIETTADNKADNFIHNYQWKC